MTLGTHAIVGAAVATLFPQYPVLAFAGGFLSHFVLDSIPHWDYQILSLQQEKGNKMNVDMKIGRQFLHDLLRIGFDALVGIILVLFLFRNSSSYPYVLLLGAIGAIIPDFLQFVYFKIKKEPFISLQKFHIYIHAERDLNEKPLFGILCQIGVVVISYFLVLNLAELFLH